MYEQLASEGALSYRLYYHRSMAQREKRSISLPPELARAVDDAARAEGAIRRGDGVVTSDAGHIRKIAEAAGSTLRIASI